METIYDRTEKLLGKKAMELLKKRKVLIFGIGGVGGYVVEALARVGVGTIGIVDFDRVDITNINRQIIALHSTIGKKKIQVMEERIHDINPFIRVETFEERLSEGTIENYHLKSWDYIVDAIDDVAGKIILIKKAKELEVPIICSMGTGFHFKPECLQITDINKTHTCPLAKLIRKELRKIGINQLKVLFSSEKPIKEQCSEEKSYKTASIAFVPGVAGLMIAAEVIKDLKNDK